MLTIVEKILFLIVAGAAVYYGYLGFRNVFLVIRRGSGEPFDMGVVVERAVRALGTWVIMKPIWKTRTVASIFHGMIAWGFTFYFLVNFGDVVQGYFPIKFMGDGAIGSAYRFLADIFSVSVLVGMTYFLLRRFVFNSPVLTFRDNIKLMDKVKAGAVRRDSLIVGLFILAHVGFRFLGETFTVALERLEMGHGDAAQPFANLVSNAVGRPGRRCPDRGPTPELVAGPGPDSGLHPLLPPHQAFPPDHVRLQLWHQAGAHQSWASWR